MHLHILMKQFAVHLGMDTYHYPESLSGVEIKSFEKLVSEGVLRGKTPTQTHCAVRCLLAGGDDDEILRGGVGEQFTWTRWCSLPCTQTDLMPLGLTWSHLVSIGLTWSHLV